MYKQINPFFPRYLWLWCPSQQQRNLTRTRSVWSGVREREQHPTGMAGKGYSRKQSKKWWKRTWEVYMMGHVLRTSESHPKSKSRCQHNSKSCWEGKDDSEPKKVGCRTSTSLFSPTLWLPKWKHCPDTSSVVETELWPQNSGSQTPTKPPSLNSAGPLSSSLACHLFLCTTHQSPRTTAISILRKQ